MKKIMIVIALIFILIFFSNAKVELIKNYQYQTIKGEKGNSKKCYKEKDKLYCIVEVEWYVYYEEEK